jgi:septum formation protein
MGFKFRIIENNVKEEPELSTDPVETVLKLSKIKAESALGQAIHGLVIGADTIVFHNGKILGKPVNKDNAREMLNRLSGKTHEVFTGFTLIQTDTGKTISDLERTKVTFRNLEDWEIENYVQTGQPLDKAGAYGIQDQSGLFVDKIEGCFYNVVGFPLTKFYESLKQLYDHETVNKLLAVNQ